MTDEELDIARADEALRRCEQRHRAGPANPATVAAKLAREGWMPTPVWLTSPTPAAVPRTWLQRIGDTIREWWAA